MSDLVIIERSNIAAVADSIRNKTGVAGDLTIGEMIDCIDSFSSGGSSDGMINMPEMCDVTLTFVRHSWAQYEGDAEIICNYLGIDETNTLKKMSIAFYTGTSGTIRCIKNSMIELVASAVEGELDTFWPMITIDGSWSYFVGGNGADYGCLGIIIDKNADIEAVVQ